MNTYEDAIQMVIRDARIELRGAIRTYHTNPDLTEQHRRAWETLCFTAARLATDGADVQTDEVSQTARTLRDQTLSKTITDARRYFENDLNEDNWRYLVNALEFGWLNINDRDLSAEYREELKRRSIQKPVSA